MPQDRFNLNTRAALLAAIGSAYPVVGSAAPAAQVDFAVGDVTALGSNGQSRVLGKGAPIEQGDTVNTNGGRAQLRFTDGAYVSLQPQSQFRIDQYRFDGKADGNEKGFFSLLKGGLRTITGLVGRNNKQNYQVTTSVATIGIRGTEYTIQYGQSITGTVGEGEINVCNGAGCLSVTNGESYYVQNQDFKPILTNKRTDLPPPAPTNPPSHFVESENVDQNGDPCVLVPCGPSVPTPPLLLTGTFTGNIATATTPSAGTPNATFSVFTGLSVLDAAGKLISITDSGGSVLGPGSTVLKDFKSDEFITWGRLTGGTLAGTGGGVGAGGQYTSPESFHYIIGAPVIAVPTGTVSYSFLGGTSPTFGPQSGSGTVALGTLVGASLTMNFASSTGLFTLNLKDPGGNPIDFTSGFVSGAALFSGFASAGGLGCSGSCSASVGGFFAGANAERAGFSYHVSNLAFSCGSAFGCGATGVVGFKQ
jgi:hypothetical protein